MGGFIAQLAAEDDEGVDLPEAGDHGCCASVDGGEESNADRCIPWAGLIFEATSSPWVLMPVSSADRKFICWILYHGVFSGDICDLSVNGKAGKPRSRPLKWHQRPRSREAFISASSVDVAQFMARTPSDFVVAPSSHQTMAELYSLSPSVTSLVIYYS